MLSKKEPMVLSSWLTSPKYCKVLYLSNFSSIQSGMVHRVTQVAKLFTTVAFYLFSINGFEMKFKNFKSVLMTFFNWVMSGCKL